MDICGEACLALAAGHLTTQLMTATNRQTAPILQHATVFLLLVVGHHQVQVSISGHCGAIAFRGGRHWESLGARWVLIDGVHLQEG